jgi:hypothetical protein
MPGLSALPLLTAGALRIPLRRKSLPEALALAEEIRQTIVRSGRKNFDIEKALGNQRQFAGKSACHLAILRFVDEDYAAELAGVVEHFAQITADLAAPDRTLFVVQKLSETLQVEA